jgi:serine phosphatase RsbU (regulator of sigma subunit)/pSer/pThr/pTyr-binding forkhead associated (FHA) protein
VSTSDTPAPHYLELHLPDATPSEWDLQAPEVSIGRARDNLLQLADESLSRRHALIRRDGVAWTFQDLGSRNGSWVNGVEVQRPVTLKPGDRIRLGSSELVFCRRLPRSEQTASTLSEATAVFDVRDVADIGEAKGLFDDVREENRALALVSRAGALLITHAPLEETFSSVLDLALEAFGAERAAVALLPDGEDSTPELAATRGGDEDTPVRLSSTVTAAVVDERKAVVVVDVAADPRLQSAHSVRLQGVNSLMCAPLWNGSLVTGLLYVDRRLGKGKYDESDLKVLSMLANVLAVKIENERLLAEAMDKQRLEEELAVARRIQQRLLPAEPLSDENLELDGICQACAEVGGDFFDHFPLAGGRTGFVVADVCGKGVGGAMLAATLQAAIRGGTRVEARAAERLSWLNAFVHEHSPADKYITAAWVEIDPAARTVTASCAGHPPVFVLRADGRVVSLDEGGLPLGLFGRAEYEESSTELEPGDRIILHTDGVTEAAGEGRREPSFGEERLVDAVRKAGPSPTDSCEAIFTELARFTENAALRDDATVVVARRR